MNASSPAPGLASLYAAARREIAKVIVGHDELVEQVLVSLFAGGHVLIEGAPGTAKTLLVRVVARLFACEFKRIQFTPDLMPADVTGTSVFDPRDQSFRFRRGPVFSQFLLTDEINRAPPKTQAALLEAMQERQVTADGVTHPLPAVFTVFATQNPIEQEGTYPLPEAQLDRFMMKVLAEYPAEAEEVEILRVHQQGARVEDLDRFGLERVGGEAELLDAQREIRDRTIRDELLGYIARVVRATRQNLKVESGASPRSGLMALAAAKTRAALHGRQHVLPDDIKAVAKPVLRHRLILKPGAEVDGFTTDDVLDEILARVEIPR
ncbi:-like atpase : Methanol dehydrogenase regulatory protein OS=Symbiobacterium thermophilum (strain T / IAM 14863) GN=moxR3 PE=4 SV=1: AAA_3 [Gemmataceae bacterium]|nr:-like atpase : Methanol dehydrogenase regulatory protein OS=Symbiobacterium thermophilum (strain T / IAM 14863) GN=moxR3 PE=4 SV=1: AAA_3 [Gemmataceae bacterium]VTU00961.1 -like atpase : Methanol dehydrogenase regulatory protein OS=Symbiobacterium thermophilum (strain T / IAM 14863) GN=moxR3 PE=4 SV=1: AAA_3 [Gemmataceae bacterium]